MGGNIDEFFPGPSYSNSASDNALSGISASDSAFHQSEQYGNLGGEGFSSNMVSYRYVCTALVESSEVYCIVDPLPTCDTLLM